MKRIYFSFLLLLSPFFTRGEDSVAKVYSKREKLLEAARAEYQKKIQEIDMKAIAELAELLKIRIARRDFESASSIKKAIAKISSGETAVTQKKSLSPVTDKKATDGTFSFNGHNYRALPFKMTHYDAVNACSSLGGHLLSIDSPAEYKFFYDYSVGESRPLWLDIYRKGPDSEWLNWKGEEAGFLKWFDGKYKKTPASNNVAINVNASKADMVRLDGRRFTNYVICEWEN